MKHKSQLPEFPLWPPGLIYQEDLISQHDEQALLRRLRALNLRPVQMLGVESKRRVIHYGWDYHYDAWKIAPAEPIPDFLLELREQAAIFAAVSAERLEQVLVSFYPAGAGIGWHRDAPMFGVPVVGVSLLSTCNLQFRRRHNRGFERFSIELNPRSVYALSGAARTEWQHGITSTPEDRYAITFRTVKESFKEGYVIL